MIVDALAVVGAVTLAVLARKAILQILKDARSKPTPWLGMPWGPG